MVDETARAIRDYFETATMRKAAEKGFDERDWQDVRTIDDGHERKRAYCEKAFAEEYDERLARMRRWIIDREGTKQPTLRHPWFRGDSFNRDRIERLARHAVHSDHRRDLDALDQERTADLAVIYIRAEARLTDRTQDRGVAGASDDGRAQVQFNAQARRHSTGPE